MSCMEKLAMFIILSLVAPFLLVSAITDSFGEQIDLQNAKGGTILDTLGAAGVQSPIGQQHPWVQAD